MALCAFDIGIKNLAFCVFEPPLISDERSVRAPALLKREPPSSSAGRSVSPQALHGCEPPSSVSPQGVPKAWANVNILPEAAPEPVKQTCYSCKLNAKYKLPSQKVSCKKHLGTVLPYEGGTKVADLKAAVVEAQLQVLKGANKKDDLLALLATKFAMPLQTSKPKKIAATHHSLTVFHDGIMKMIDQYWSYFKDVTRFALENQPVLKNPTMKTVQILLYASLRSAFIAKGLKVPAVDLVHASKKVRGATTGDAGYAERKTGSEERAIAYLKANAPAWLPTITEAKKKSDLADALCMCLDLSAS
jgi:hypothetical protein